MTEETYLKDEKAEDKDSLTITYRQAVSCLIETTKEIHTLDKEMQDGSMTRKEVREFIKNSNKVMLSGQWARSTGHGICAHNDEGNPIFFHTNKRKVDSLLKEMGVSV